MQSLMVASKLWAKPLVMVKFKVTVGFTPSNEKYR